MDNPQTRASGREITLIVVDDHPILRGGLTKLLELEPDLRVIAEAGTGKEALDIFQGRPETMQPTVMLLDINLPDLNGFEVALSLKTARVRTAVILMTAYDDPEQKVQAMRLGASAYCPKAIEPRRLFEVIRLVAHGRKVIDDKDYDEQGVQAWLTHQTKAFEAISDPERHMPLSPRELEILRCVTRGMSNKVIAQQLKISHQTVRNHMTSILAKLNVNGRTQAALYAIQRGWVRAHEYRPPPDED